jgi:hypothetical protein
VAAFAGLGIAIGILMSMVVILMQNYQTKMCEGKDLVVHEGR